MSSLRIWRGAIFLLLLATGFCQKTPYYGAQLGHFLTISNNVKGEAFAVDDYTIFVKGFSYDGLNGDAVFWAGSSGYPDESGFTVPNDVSKFMPLPAFLHQNIILRLPDGIKVEDVQWLCVWDRNSSKSLGTLIFLKPIQPPHPMTIGTLVNTKKGVSTGDILILDTQTFLIPNFYYDGTGKDAHWWLSKGTRPNEEGTSLYQNGSDAPLEQIKNSTVIITLPNGHFIQDYDTLSIWSRSDGEHYGFIDVPKNLNIPPSSRVLESQELSMDNFNCEMLNDNLGLEVRWSIRGDDAIISLVGNIAPSEYMALGLSKDDTETKFDSADAAIAGIDSEGKGFAVDYFLESNEKCENGRGMCPDSVHGSVNNLELIQAERKGNLATVMFKRRLRADDKVYDQNIFTDGPQAILWAVGPMLSDGFPDTPTLQSRGNLLLDFGREPNWNCPQPKREISPHAYSKEIERIHCPGDRSFRAQLGSSPRSAVKKVWYINGIPTPELVVQRGNTYTFIIEGSAVKKVWYINGIPTPELVVQRGNTYTFIIEGSAVKKVWYINGIPTPELVVQRGNTYTFIIEGGLNPPHHHPFYITSSQVGGMYKNILEAGDESEVTYAGIQEDEDNGTIFPTAEGRLCDWSYSDKKPDFSVKTAYHEVKPVLNLKCEPGKPGKLMWTPNAETPDEVYYQSFTERNLGGKIQVVDFCEETNPHGYLENGKKGSKSNDDVSSSQKHESENEKETFFPERENESSESIEQNQNVGHVRETETEEPTFSNTRIDHLIVRSVAETPDPQYGDSPNSLPEKIEESFPPAEDQHIVSNNIINSYRISSDNIKERISGSSNQRETTKSDEIFPHDESERSDVYASHSTNNRKNNIENKAALSSHRDDDIASKHPIQSASQATSVSALTNQRLHEFKPQFEGGFIPLVTNPMKEKEVFRAKEIIQLPQHRRPHRPFLYNESVPFHGTFKPGVPDFSGFNISNYSQEDASVVLGLNQGNIPASAASKPQLIHKPFPGAGNTPFHGNSPIHLPQGSINHLHRPQRIQDLGNRQPQQQLLPPGMRKNIFPHFTMNNKQHFPIHNLRDEDLTGVSSQRVFVSMQTTADKKENIPNQLNSLSHNRKPPQFSQPNKTVNRFPFQHRPDLHEVKQTNLRQSNIPKRQLNVPHMPPNINNGIQSLNMPMMQLGGMHRQIQNRPGIPNAKIPLNSFQDGTNQAKIPPGHLRHQYAMMQVAQRERFSQVPQLQQETPTRHFTAPDEKLKMNDGLLVRPQIPHKMFPFPLHMLYHQKTAQGNLESKEPQSDSSSKEHRPLPHLINAELVEIPNKNTPQASSSEIFANNDPEKEILALGETEGAVSTVANIEETRPVSGGSTQNTPPEIDSNIYLETELKNLKKLSQTTSETGVGVNSDFHSVPPQHPGKDKYQIQKEKKGNAKFNEPQKISGHTTSNSHHEFNTPIHESSSSVEDFSSSETFKLDLSPFSDYEHEDKSVSSDSHLSVNEHSHFNVPFGARLKFSQNASRIPTQTLNGNPKVPFRVQTRPHGIPSNNENRKKNIVNSVASTIPKNKIIASTSESTSISTSIETIDKAIEKLSHFPNENKQSIPTDKDEGIKHLYYAPPFSTSSVHFQMKNSTFPLNENTGPAIEMKHIPIIADTLEGIIEANYLGRKNILSNHTGSSFPPFMMPQKVTDGINLPQISEKPPTNDNKTDYSILNHVLTLIGGPPEQKESEA